MAESTIGKISRFGYDPARRAILKSGSSVLRGGSVKKTSSKMNLLPPEKISFLTSVLVTTIIQLVIAFTVFMFVKNDNSEWSLLYGLAGLVLLIVIAFFPMPLFVKLILYTIFSACMGIVLGRTARRVPNSVIETALVGTIVTFAALLCVGIFVTSMGYDLSWMGLGLMFALLAIIIIRIVFMFMKESPTSRKVITCVSLLLFSAFVVYDTNIILQKDYAGDFVTASLDYFLDIINIFSDMIALYEK